MTAADGLRRAAAVLEEIGTVWVPTASGELILSPAAARPVALWLRAAAQEIDLHHGQTLGLPVSYALEFAGVLLSEDLGHNR